MKIWLVTFSITDIDEGQDEAEVAVFAGDSWEDVNAVAQERCNQMSNPEFDWTVGQIKQVDGARADRCGARALCVVPL